MGILMPWKEKYRPNVDGRNRGSGQLEQRSLIQEGGLGAHAIGMAIRAMHDGKGKKDLVDSHRPRNCYLGHPESPRVELQRGVRIQRSDGPLL